MTGAEYKNAIMSALSEADQTADPISIIRTVLGNCDTDFPYGDCRGILAALSKNDFMGWRACSYDEAKKFADEGVPTVGINDERIVIIVPDDHTLSSDKSDTKSKFVVSANSITNEEESSMKFFASSESVFALPSSYGTTEDVEAINEDGFGGFYVPVSGNKKGVQPRYAYTVTIYSTLASSAIGAVGMTKIEATQYLKKKDLREQMGSHRPLDCFRQRKSLKLNG